MNSLVEALRQEVPGRDVRLSVTAEGERLLQRLGGDWLAAVVRSAVVAFPEQQLEFTLIEVGNDPMPPAKPISFGKLPVGVNAAQRMGLLSVSGQGDDIVCRTLSVPNQMLLDDKVPLRFVAATAGVKRTLGDVYGRIYRDAPLMLDRWKQWQNNRKYWGDAANDRVCQPVRAVDALNLSESSPSIRPAAWIAMHWLEPGGAESWALETISLACQAGFDVVVTVDRAAPQRLLTKVLAMTPHVYLAANCLDKADFGDLYRHLLERFDIQTLHIHHSATAYQFLLDLKHLAPDVMVIDSVHIAEHRTGGFVLQSLQNSEMVDLHHVISPVLRDAYTLDAHVPASKVAYHPLIGLDNQEPSGAPVSRDPSVPLRVGFLGRLAPQKRPFLFIELVRRVHRATPDDFHFIMQGSGSLDENCTRQIAQCGLQNVIQRREWGPADVFFDDIDVLVISSDNEGLTLTALEADAHGVLVLSADVGSQVTVVAQDLLAPREPDAFLKQAQVALRRCAKDPGFFESSLREQRALHQALRSQESASSFIARTYQKIREETP